MDNQLDFFLASFSRETRENVLCLRKLVLDVFPTAVEKIDSKPGLITYGYNSKGSKVFVCAIAPYMKHVNLLFSKGALLSDPSRLLAGKGDLARHIKIKSEAETANPALRQLLKDATKLNYNK